MTKITNDLELESILTENFMHNVPAIFNKSLKNNPSGCMIELKQFIYVGKETKKMLINSSKAKENGWHDYEIENYVDDLIERLLKEYNIPRYLNCANQDDFENMILAFQAIV